MAERAMRAALAALLLGGLAAPGAAAVLVPGAAPGAAPVPPPVAYVVPPPAHAYPNYGYLPAPVPRFGHTPVPAPPEGGLSLAPNAMPPILAPIPAPTGPTCRAGAISCPLARPAQPGDACSCPTPRGPAWGRVGG
jgi:hypothetical protein